MKFYIVAIVLVSVAGFSAYSDEDHHSHKDKKSVDVSSQTNHKGEENHSDKEGHGHEEEKNENIGLGKGIVSADEEIGFKISAEAEKNFEIRRIKIAVLDQIKVPKAAIVTAGEETNIYRFRNGFYKRIDFNVVKKNGENLLVISKDLKQSDEVVVHGTGLLRIAELAAFGGAPQGHSH